MLIMLTNDDGIYASGLRAIYTSLKEAGHEVHVIAPLKEQSAVGHSITILHPLRVKRIEEHGFVGLGVSGTPADCVKLGISQLMPDKPEVLISGINAGPNVGPDILYSGTVAAAREAAHMGIPSVAFSHDSFEQADVSQKARYAASLLARLPLNTLPDRRVLNVNFPSCPADEMRGLAVCPQTTAIWNDWYTRREDPRGRPYWWLDGTIPMDQVAEGTDKDLLTKGWVTLTPLRFDFTDFDYLETLRGLMGE